MGSELSTAVSATPLGRYCLNLNAASPISSWSTSFLQLLVGYKIFPMAEHSKSTQQIYIYNTRARVQLKINTQGLKLTLVHFRLVVGFPCRLGPTIWTVFCLFVFCMISVVCNEHAVRLVADDVASVWTSWVQFHIVQDNFSFFRRVVSCPVQPQPCIGVLLTQLGTNVLAAGGVASVWRSWVQSRIVHDYFVVSCLLHASVPLCQRMKNQHSKYVCMCVWMSTAYCAVCLARHCTIQRHSFAADILLNVLYALLYHAGPCFWKWRVWRVRTWLQDIPKFRPSEDNEIVEDQDRSGK